MELSTANTAANRIVTLAEKASKQFANQLQTLKVYCLSKHS